MTGFIQRITKHCYSQNIKAIGHMISEIFYVFLIVSLLELMTPGVGQLLTPGV